MAGFPVQKYASEIAYKSRNRILSMFSRISDAISFGDFPSVSTSNAAVAL